MLRPDQIRTDGGTQSRAAINEATVAEYAETMEDPSTVFPPVVVYHDGRDYWLADGFHRLAAWERIGRTEVPAEIRQGDRRRAVLHACGANAAHGLRRSNADKRRAVMTLLDDAEWSQWSARQIAKQCGVSHDFVARMKREQGAQVSSDDTPPDYPEPVSGSRWHTETEFQSERTNREDGAIGREGYAPDGSSRLPVGRTAGPSDTGETIAEAEAAKPANDAAAGGSPAQDGELHDPVHAEMLDAAAAEPEDPATAKLRCEARKLTREALEDEWISLRADLEDQKAKRKKAEHERDEYKARLDEALAGDDMGRALGSAQKQRDTAKHRLGEEQAKNARQQRRINAQDAEIKQLREQLEKREITL